MVFNDRFRCDAAYVLDRQGSSIMVLAQSLGDADRQASRDEKAIAALARRLAVIMHRIWVDGTEFRWTREQATTAA